MQISDLTEEFVLSETKKLQRLYKLKTEIRYDCTREEDDISESVAEHIYAMHILAMYFLPLEDPGRKLDVTKILKMITLHDIDEIETGDTIGYMKTEEMRAEEEKAMKRVISKAPNHLQSDWLDITDEYEQQTSPESRFVKAIDRFEPLIHLYSASGKKIITKNKSTTEQSQSLKTPYVKNYPYIKIFAETINNQMVKEGYWYKSD